MNKKQKLVRKYICPDRFRNGSLKRRSETSKYEPDVKKHCSNCLNTNLVSVNEISNAVNQLVHTTCDQCGVLWKDIKETRKGHLDMHIRNSASRVGIDISAKINVRKHNDKSIEDQAYLRYCSDNLGSATTKVSKFSKLTEEEKQKYTSKVEGDYKQDMSFLKGTAFWNDRVDDRPAVDLLQVPFFLHPKNSKRFPFHEIVKTYGTYRYIFNYIQDEVSPHVTFQTDIDVSTDNWGTEDYVCYKCTEPLEIDFTSTDCPKIKDSKACSCSIHNPTEYTDREVDPPEHVSPQLDLLMNILTPKNGKRSKPVKTQIPVTYLGKKNFLYQCNDMFSAYVIHLNCCNNPFNKNNL